VGLHKTRLYPNPNGVDHYVGNHDYGPPAFMERTRARRFAGLNLAHKMIYMGRWRGTPQITTRTSDFADEGYR